MLKDNTEFRDRFTRWKAGELVYENGRPLPAYGDGKGSRKWTPNQQTRRSISRYEGDAMVKDTIDPLTGKMAKKNASFESVADSFVSTFSPETWEKVKGNDALLQALYHYAYNIGPGKFKERTLPMVDAYYRGEATVRDILNAMWAHGDKKLRGLANRRIAERAMVEKALSDQFPAASLVPYRNDDYNYYRANQLGYKPDKTGHMPSRDEVTGMYLKSPTHPTIMKSVVLDLSEGYQPYYNKQDGRIYSQPMFDVKQWVEGLLFKGLPGYGGGKGAFGLMPIDITSTLRNLYRAAKNRAYRTITPQDYNIPKATRLFISGKNRDKQKISPIRNEEWARYLGVPYEGESGFEPSPYRPLKGKTYNTVLRFKDESEILSDLVLNQMLEHQRKTGKNSLLVEGNGGGLGSYTLSLGEDKQGKYISYYDDWDINPFKGISSKINIPIISNIEDIVPGSNPYTVYGRRYYTEGDVKNLRKNNTRNEPRNK